MRDPEHITWLCLVAGIVAVVSAVDAWRGSGSVLAAGVRRRNAGVAFVLGLVMIVGNAAVIHYDLDDWRRPVWYMPIVFIPIGLYVERTGRPRFIVPPHERDEDKRS